MFCFFYRDTVHIWKHHLSDVLEKVLEECINHLKLRKTSTESIKAKLGGVHFTKIIIYIFTKMISFACAFAVILLFLLKISEWLLPTITVITVITVSQSFHYIGLFSEKASVFNINLFPMAKTLANLRQFFNIIRCNTMIATLDIIWVITCWVKGRKKRTKLINTNVITRHNAIAMSRDHQSWRSSFSLIQTYLLFPVFSLWNYPFCRIILCTWCNFSSSLKIFSFVSRDCF